LREGNFALTNLFEGNEKFLCVEKKMNWKKERKKKKQENSWKESTFDKARLYGQYFDKSK